MLQSVRYIYSEAINRDPEAVACNDYSELHLVSVVGSVRQRRLGVQLLANVTHIELSNGHVGGSNASQIKVGTL